MIELLRRHPPGHEALLEPGRGVRIVYGDLLARVDAAAARLGALAGARAGVFLGMGPDAGSVVLYLAGLEARVALCLAEPQAAPLARLAGAYAPELLLLPEGLEAPAGYARVEPPLEGRIVWRGPRAGGPVAHPDLALLLTTSGSTGSPKLVRLTRGNLASNARSIVEYLGIGPGERAVASLPMHYSYGLSVLNSHLVAGAAVALTPHSFMRPEFWAEADAAGCTSFAGVPYMYETLHRLRFDPARHPTLRTLTQAGGGLRPDLVEHYLGLAQRSGRRFFVMYGQTEATARISYVPFEELPRKVGSIGVAIPGGRLRLEPVEGGEGLQELVYEGPNVMLGYAESPADLALGDALRGVLRTGDLGRADGDGYFWLSGRLTRFAKLFGRRVSLEDVERELESSYPVRVAATDGGDRIVVHAETGGAVGAEALAAHVARLLAVPPTAVAVHVVGALPRTASGKKDYRALEVAG